MRLAAVDAPVHDEAPTRVRAGADRSDLMLGGYGSTCIGTLALHGGYFATAWGWELSRRCGSFCWRSLFPIQSGWDP